MDEMKEITCSNCDVSIRVHASSLGHIIPHLPALSGGDFWLNYLCPECKHLQFAHVHPGKLQSNEPDQSEPSEHIAASLVWLECVQGCQPPQLAVALFLKKGICYDQVTADMNEWILLDAKCPKGHPARAPLKISSAKSQVNFLL